MKKALSTHATFKGLKKQLFFLPTRYGHLSAMLCSPARASATKGKKPTLIFSHGIGPDNSMVECGRLFLRLAERLAKQGYASLLFAYPGTAESDGFFAAMSPRQRVFALRDVIKWFVAQKMGPYAVFGFSMGAGSAICALNAKLPAQPAFLITLNAVPSFEAKDKSYHAWHAPAPEIHLSSGLGPKFFSDGPGVTIAESYAKIDVPKLHIAAGRDMAHFTKEFRAIFNADTSSAPKMWIDIPGATHGFDLAEHQKALLDSVDAWLKKSPKA